MSDELLPYYNSELAFVRDLLRKEFAQTNPKMAARLGIGEVDREETNDPHVRRLIEGVAYLNARIRYKLDDDFPEISDAFLNVLYPHYLVPIPSFTVIQFNPDPGNTDIDAKLSRDTELETIDQIDGLSYRFRTCYPVMLWPIRVEAASIHGLPLPAPVVPQSRYAQSILRLELRCLNNSLMFSQLGLSSPFEKHEKLPLCFFLKGQEQQVYPLYDYLCNSPLQVVIAKNANDPNPVILGPESLRPMGFKREEGLLPYPPQSFLGYRILTEYFAFPEKFLFLEFAIEKKHLRLFGNSMEIYVYCANNGQDLQRHVNPETFALGCTPIVNLFSQWADQGLLNYTQSEIEVTPSERHRNAMEIYSIDSVSASDSAGESFDYLPFYGSHHNRDVRNPRYWFSNRQPARLHKGTDTFIKLVDLDFRPSTISEHTLHIQLTCLNHNLPSMLPFGGGQPRLQLRDNTAPLQSIICLTKPTPSLNSSIKQGAVWKLISHLSLNHLSITDTKEGAQSLKEILNIYDYKNTHMTHGQIQGIEWVDCKTSTCRVPGSGFDNICQGTVVNVGIDQGRFEGRSLLLFTQVLEYFLALYCSINSYTQLRVFDKSDHDKKELLYKWQPRSGEHPLL